MKAYRNVAESLFLSRKTKYLILILLLSLLPSCTFLSNSDYVQKYAAFRGIRRVAIFLQHWPVYLQKPGRNSLGDDFITPNTYFWAPWKPAARLNPRAVDIQDINAAMVGKALVKVLGDKGFQVSLVDLGPLGAETLTVQRAMAEYQAINPEVDAFLFCYYSPTLYFSWARDTPKDHQTRSYGLQEIIDLAGSKKGVLWVGERGPQAPGNSISHAFIYLSMTMFRARDWQMLLEVADSQTGGKVHPWIPECLPGPTDQNYWADSGVIQRLMINNFECRLRHLIPYAF